MFDKRFTYALWFANIDRTCFYPHIVVGRMHYYKCVVILRRALLIIVLLFFIGIVGYSCYFPLTLLPIYCRMLLLAAFALVGGALRWLTNSSLAGYGRKT